MTDPADLPMTAKPPLAARFAFAAAREPNLTMLLSTSLLLGCCLGSPVLLAALGEREAARFVLIAAGLATFAWFVVGLLFITPIGRTLASPGHIAAALHAATAQERPHLLRQIEERVGNIYRTDPLTIDELTRLFGSVRQDHGEQARRRVDREDRIRRAQQDYVAGLMAPETGREAPQEPR
ncbi:hypothetical protein PK98_15695 [Croceibacterium mercuriale]|uniref:Uncharacterized protein n=1 Tax=Croceibacterium mercuriale TaxID=1572751 RepID=A0A0B2BRF9_9SPHN|nr:hypothetical protein [Croceibacterium mercuriale]KHL24125.1 hypothetical protein PK98_15695 [Croceibacterium mercuriale]